MVSIVALGRINHDLIYIEKEKPGDYKINEAFGGPAGYASLVASAQNEKVGLVSYVGKDFFTDSMYKELRENPNIDCTGIKNVYEKMPELRVWYPNNPKQLTIGMIWDKNLELKIEDIPQNYLKADMYLFMPMINEISGQLIKQIDKENPDAIKLIDIQGKLRYLQPAYLARDWGNMPKNLIEEWTQRENSQRVYYDKCKDLEDILAHVDIVKANEGELEVLTGTKDLNKGIEKLIKLGAEVGNPDLVVTVTLGEKGCIIGYNDHGIKYEKIPPVPPRTKEIDPTGAGDTFSTSFLIEYTRTKNIKKAGRYAVAAASLAIETPGPRDCPTRDEIYSRMEEIFKE
jgi:sugar/nucleoside kinase (ribokinase family)